MFGKFVNKIDKCLERLKALVALVEFTTIMHKTSPPIVGKLSAIFYFDHGQEIGVFSKIDSNIEVLTLLKLLVILCVPRNLKEHPRSGNIHNLYRVEMAIAADNAIAAQKVLQHNTLKAPALLFNGLLAFFGKIDNFPSHLPSPVGVYHCPAYR